VKEVVKGQPELQAREAKDIKDLKDNKDTDRP